MRHAPFAGEADVDEALRLFQVSTLDAAMSGNLAGARLFSSGVLFPCIKVSLHLSLHLFLKTLAELEVIMARTSQL